MNYAASDFDAILVLEKPDRKDLGVKRLILIILFVTIAGLGPMTRARADEFAEAKFKVTSVAVGLSMLEGAGGNVTAFVGRDGVFLVDDDFAPMAEKLVAKLKELGGSSPRYIANTHFHYDHTGGNEVFGTSATIIAATAVRDRLSKEQTLWKTQHAAAPPQALPALTFDRSLTLHINDDEIEMLHLPHGHTDGDTVVFFKNAKAASLGDLYFAGMYPIFHPEHRGSFAGYIRNLKTVLRRLPAGAKIIPGHGPLSTKSELERYLRMIVASREAVQKAMAAGKSLQRIQTAGLGSDIEAFGHGYVSTARWIEVLYRDLARN